VVEVAADVVGVLSFAAFTITVLELVGCGRSRYWRRKIVGTGPFPENDPSRVTVKSADRAANAKMMMRVDRSTLAGRALESPIGDQETPRL